MSTPEIHPRAAAVVETTLLAANSRRIPPFHRAIVSARFEADGRVVATLVMIDGLKAEVECAQDRRGRWGYRWIWMDGGGIEFRDG